MEHIHRNKECHIFAAEVSACMFSCWKMLLWITISIALKDMEFHYLTKIVNQWSLLFKIRNLFPLLKKLKTLCQYHVQSTLTFDGISLEIFIIIESMCCLVIKIESYNHIYVSKRESRLLETNACGVILNGGSIDNTLQLTVA